ncbi:MAG: alpha-glucan family phosphorylase [Phycisphaerales bacterium]|nr:alpha-glucan family phosphorylase [Phycisphaerales bacterium]
MIERNVPGESTRNRLEDDPRAIRHRLKALSKDLWWSWNEIGRRPFAMLDPELWEAVRYSPFRLLQKLDSNIYTSRLAEPSFREVAARAINAHHEYHNRRSWHEANSDPSDPPLRIAYFCSEYAIHESLPQYAGGLGVLAGDHLKSASDLGLPLIAVGLLYQHGYYKQEFRDDGSTRVIYPSFDADAMPLEDTGVRLDCPIGDRTVRVRIWSMSMGRVPLYLLDANLPGNRVEDRALTASLYQGDDDIRLQRQVLLGVGGFRALRLLEEIPTVIHLNEGHAAFAAVAKMAELVQGGMDLEEAKQLVRSSTVFTTHTPVPAGNQRYDANKLREALKPVLEPAGLDPDMVTQLGRENPDDQHEAPCMTVLALRLAERVNGVSELHGAVSRDMWKNAYGLEDPDQVPIKHITNGVHTGTWMAPVAERFWSETIEYTKTPGPKNPCWARAESVDPRAFWDLREALRRRLLSFVRRRLAIQSRRRGESPERVVRSRRIFQDSALTIGFARRFATYKRATLLFHDLDRLANILGNPDRPVQVIFAGKAHPADEGGQAVAQRIHDLCLESRFDGRIVLLENYDIEIGRRLTSGCDLWLNTPRRPFEASGTSGMKPPLHGGLNCSIPDGWWVEADDGRNGWTIGDGSSSENEGVQDDQDANILYDLLEQEIIPAFWDRDDQGLPQAWIERALHTVATIPEWFNTDRMVAEYLEWGYKPASVQV